MQNVAELMGHDALEFVSGEGLRCSACDADDSGVDVEAGGEGVDALFFVEQIDRRHGGA